MDIINANNLKNKEQIKELILKTFPPNSEQQIGAWLDFNLGTDVFGAWITYEENEPIGFVTCEIVEPYNPKAFIAFAYMKPGKKGGQEMLLKIEDWAKEKDIHKLLFHTRRSPRAFVRKYGFTLSKSILEKEI